jgi:elongation factor Ts
MAEITAALVKSLRERTGQGMMECKKALTEANGDMEAAIELLRKRGLAKAETKATRATSEGLIGIHATDGSAAMVEIACETDFCARNDEFQSMVEQVARMAAEADAGPVEAGDRITQTVQDCFEKIGENMKYVRGVKVEAATVGTYLHHNRKVGVVVALDGELDEESLQGLCMHIAFSDPVAIRPEDVPGEMVEKERRLATEEAHESGKPPQIVEKMVEGKVNKFLSANALLEQDYVRDESKKVKEVLGSATLKSFARFAVGQE